MAKEVIKMDTAIKFLYLSEPDMVRAGVTDMDACVEAMEDLLLTLHKGDYVMGGKITTPMAAW
jgi:hypothetical protein